MIEGNGELETLLGDLPALGPAQRVARVLGAGAPDEILARLGDEAERLAVADAGRALAATECLVEIADALRSPLARARARRARAHALCNSGRLQEGWLECDAAARLAEEAGRPVEAGLARMRSMQALGELGRFDESIAAGEAALAAFRGAAESALAARAEVNLGIVYQRRDEPARAVEHFDRARPMLGDSPLALGTVDNNRGEALLALNDFAGAESAFESALDHYERAGAALVAAVAEGNLADLAARQGLLPRALYHFERARRRFERTQSAGHLSRLLAEQAEAMSVLGMPAEALAEYESAIPRLDRAGQALEAARARAGLGRTLVRLRRCTDAETALAAAARAFEQLGHATARARVDLIRAELAAANGLPAEARRLIHEALVVLHDRPIEAATARLLLARLAAAEDDLDGAAADLAAAYGIARRLDLAPLLSDVLHSRGALNRACGNLPAAVADLTQAQAEIERVRGTLQAQRFRAAFLGDRLAVYEDLVGALLELGGADSIASAFGAAEQAKSRLLLEMLRGGLELSPGAAGAGTGEPGDAPLRAEHARCRAELNALYSRLGGDAPVELDRGWRESVLERERRLDDLEGRLSAAHGVAGLYARPAGLDEVASTLPAGTTLIEYFTAGREVLAFAAGAGGAVVKRLGDRRTLEEHVARVQFQINRALRPGALAGWRARRLLDDAKAELGALDRVIMAPLRPSIPSGDRLLIVPHGALHVVPFAALWDGEQFLVERHEIHTAPSASVYLQLCRRPQPDGAGARRLVVGVADEAAPRIDEEARRVAAALGCEQDALIGPEATGPAVCRAIPGAGVIHLACHARFTSSAPLGSGVRLADRWLTVRDIFKLRLEAELVTLSGCETGRSLVHAADELMGLLRGFLAAGASSLLASLWRVDDDTAAELMCSFYELWQPGALGQGKAAALRAAQLRLLQRRPHPALWAPFQLVGRP